MACFLCCEPDHGKATDAEQHRALHLLPHSILPPDTSSLTGRATAEKVIKGFRL